MMQWMNSLRARSTALLDFLISTKNLPKRANWASVREDLHHLKNLEEKSYQKSVARLRTSLKDSLLTNDYFLSVCVLLLNFNQ